jgi:hypothetical protein
MPNPRPWRLGALASAAVLAQLADKQEQLDEQIEALADQLRGPGAPR